jgi:hypothetical protein
VSARGSVSELARRLAREAEAACRHYLPKGQRQGNYWTVGDAAGTPGRSLYVRLKGPDSGKGAAGKWTDAATGEHGDLLDLIALNRELPSLRDAMEEARDFLRLPRREPTTSPTSCPSSQAAPGSTEAARRLFAASKPIAGTIAETHLRARGIDCAKDLPALRFHPRCYHYGRDCDHADGRTRVYPALIAAVTDNDAALVAVHRTWLNPDGVRKADVASPRRALGPLLGNGVRFGGVTSLSPVMIAGEGIETVLSLLMAMPALPMIAAGSANHLAAIVLPPALQRLYIAIDNDPEGRRACQRLSRRALDADIEALPLVPLLGDFNDDLRRLGLASLRETLGRQLLPADAAGFLAFE